jgi:hypothetical protein
VLLLYYCIATSGKSRSGQSEDAGDAKERHHDDEEEEGAKDGPWSRLNAQQPIQLAVYSTSDIERNARRRREEMEVGYNLQELIFEQPY